MRTWEQYEKDRYGSSHQDRIQRARDVVKILEDWLGIHPFPKYKHTAKFIKNESK